VSLWKTRPAEVEQFLTVAEPFLPCTFAFRKMAAEYCGEMNDVRRED
jgi:hypothetical protein